MGLLSMSEKERDRLGVVKQVTAGLVSVRQGAELLGISARQLRRSIRRYECDGDVGLTHQARGRESNRRVAEAAREQAVEQLRQDDWSDFGPTSAAEKLAEYVGIVVGRETVRQWQTVVCPMIEEDLWKPRPRKGTHRSWRQRRECFGELVQMDTSIHDWFEGRGEQAVLVCLVDDATGRKFARFFASDTTAANMAILRDYIRRYGRPRAVYADKASHFVTTRASSVEEQLEDRQPETQVGRALRELGIEQIVAHSPCGRSRPPGQGARRAGL